jgi:hypothetical protein
MQVFKRTCSSSERIYLSPKAFDESAVTTIDIYNGWKDIIDNITPTTQLPELQLATHIFLEVFLFWPLNSSDSKDHCPCFCLPFSSFDNQHTHPAFKN